MRDLLLKIAADEGARAAAAWLAVGLVALVSYNTGHAEGRRIERNNQKRRMKP